jgi:HD-like signal output (HDOD) protein
VVEVRFDSPSQPLFEAHCRRVAALALETATCLGLPAEEKHILEQAALLHHNSCELLAPKVLARLMRDLAGPTGQALVSEGTPAGFPAPGPQALLEALHHRPATALHPRISTLTEILEIANFFDERLQFLPYELVTVEQILDELGWMVQEGFYRPAIVTALASLPRIPKERLLEKVHRLPVFPVVALKVLELTSDQDASFLEMERLVSRDQVLAGRILQAANSGLYNPSGRIASIRQAISYIGLEVTRKVLMVVVFQPLFASAGLHLLWKHSLEIAELAERLTAFINRHPAGQAFLAGLVHDVGRLALLMSSGEDVIAYQRLLDRGCEPVFAEMVLCGFDHGAAGADILRWWSFPEHLTEAVERHHQPEHSDSELASILYLAEFWAGSKEDLESAARLHHALKRTGIPLDLLEQPATPASALIHLLAAA